jgi:hypothetical protein
MQSVKNIIARDGKGIGRRSETEPPQRRRQPWPKAKIQGARRQALIPILRQRGYHLREMPDENYLVEDCQDLVVKDFYWIWKSRELQGNAIDFFMLVECRSFDEAMEILDRKP